MGVIGSAAVLGAGIAGMQASLDLAEMGYKVYLIEEKPAIGGVMAGLDKTFPTNDCAMCIMSPKLVDLSRHPNITLITNAELKRIEGEAGNFRLSVLKKTRYVDEDLCNGCGDCAENCPVSLPSEHDDGLGTRGAIYRRYPQAIPNLFSIDKQGTPPCRNTCPAHVNIQGYIALLSAGKYRKAYDLIRETHPFPSVCGRICHHPCESACNRKEIDEPVAINHLKRFIADSFLGEKPEDLVFCSPCAPTGKKVAVIGAGPGGLTAAGDLANQGHSVTVFEREEKPGGTLYTGIPGFRLNKEVLFKEADVILANPNITVEYKTEIGKTISLKDLKDKGFDAVFLATGANTPKGFEIEGAASSGVLAGTEFLRDVNTGVSVKLDGTVLVIGGGNVASDSARAALRCGADSVKIIYRRTQEEMPAYPWEISEALEEGVEIHSSWAPEEVVQKDGKVAGLKCIRHERIYDVYGNYESKFFPEVKTTFSGEYIITAIGQDPDISAAAGWAGESLVERGRFSADPLTLQTSVSWLFAGGDAVTGPASAVEAVAAGHRAAESIARFLENGDLRRDREWAPVKIAQVPDRPVVSMARQPMPALPALKRISGFDEMETGFSQDAAVKEADRCLHCGSCSECMVCVEVCGREAVDHNLVDEELSIETGALVIATGFERFNPSSLFEYGYGRYKNVLTSYEFERLLSASGPTGGHVTRLSDGRIPKKIAWVQCVGSRQMRDEGKEYCSGVCCMFSIKEAVIAKEHEPSLNCHIYYMDIRAYGKDFDSYYERAKGEYGVSFRRARLSLVEEIPGTDDLRVKYVDESERVLEERYDMVVLATGFLPAGANEKLSALKGVSLNRFGFFDSGTFIREKTNVDGIYVCGNSVSPMDIPDTVATSSASASYVSALLSPARNTMVSPKEYPEEIQFGDEEPRVGVFVCHCGINIGSVVDVPGVVEYASGFPGVAYAEENLYTCSHDTQKQIKEAVTEHNLNRVVVASCTPRTHEALFQDTLKEVGLNSFLFEFVGIREQCSWVHMKEPEKATAKAKELVSMGISKARLLTPFSRSSSGVVKAGVVVGGGISGMTAALSLAEQGFHAYLVEEKEELGGNVRNIFYTLPDYGIKGYLKELEDKIRDNNKVSVLTGYMVENFSGYAGNYRSVLKSVHNGDPVTLEHGALIIAAGAAAVVPESYGYGKNPSVMTQRELEEHLSAGKTFLRIVMIQCVESRDELRPYCSRICCQEAVKNCLKILEINPEAEITVFYRDIRTYGFSEEYYQKAREGGVNFIRYSEEEKPEVTIEGDGSLRVNYHDLIMNTSGEITPDAVILSTGMEPKGQSELSGVLKVPLTRDGFFLEAHAKLKPLDFPTEGVYVCGAAHSPKTISESISQAAGAAARAVTLLSKETISSTGKTVKVKDRICSGCGVCVEVCPFEARKIDIETGKATIIEVLCQGCGACATACPNGATEQSGYTKAQIYRMLEEVL